MTTRKYSERKEFTVQAAPCSDVLDLSNGRIEEAGPVLGNHTESRFGVFVITVGLTGEIDRTNRMKILTQSRAAMLVIFLLSKRSRLGVGVTDALRVPYAASGHAARIQSASVDC